MEKDDFVESSVDLENRLRKLATLTAMLEKLVEDNKDNKDLVAYAAQSNILIPAKTLAEIYVRLIKRLVDAKIENKPFMLTDEDKPEMGQAAVLAKMLILMGKQSEGKQRALTFKESSDISTKVSMEFIKSMDDELMKHHEN